MVVTNDPALISSVGDSGDGASDNPEKERKFAEEEREKSSPEPRKSCSPQVRCFCFLGMIGELSRNEVDDCDL